MRILIYCSLAAAGLFLGLCVLPEGRERDVFAGNWQGSGTDSGGNKFTFAARAIALGGGKYRVLILDTIDTQKEPLHIMDGELLVNEYQYTADAEK